MQQKLVLTQYILRQEEHANSLKIDPTLAERLKNELDTLARDKVRINAEIAILRDGWDTFRAKLLQQRRSEAFKGFLGDFTMTNGRVLEDVRISRIEDGGVSLIHSTGAARLRFGDLNSAQQVYFGLDAELATIAFVKERKQQITNAKWGDAVLAANEAKKQILSVEKREEEKKLANAKAIAAISQTRRVSLLSASIGALGESSADNRRYFSRRFIFKDRPSVRYRYYYIPQNSCTNGIPIWGNSSSFRPVPSCSQVTPFATPTYPFSL